MHVPTHILSGWLVGNALRFGPRERLFCMLASALPDLDGLGFFLGEEAYWRFHHTAGHNVFFGVALSIGFAAASTRRGLAFGAYLVCFHLHLLMDFYGSGPGWAIHYLWPIDARGWRTIDAWPLNGWQNRVAFLALLAVTVLIARRKRRTPLELLAPRLEAKLTSRTS
ncbi:MAG: hypothetical protein JWO69_1914 [Thermoleophilia bacterium]|nr:hypothetical protein [Thermoleophilia bacterium]